MKEKQQIFIITTVHLPKNRALHVFFARAHIPSRATAAAHKSYHEAVSSGAVISMDMVHPPVTIKVTF